MTSVPHASAPAARSGGCCTDDAGCCSAFAESPQRSPAVAASPQGRNQLPQIASVQRVLGSFGYLQMSPNGIMGPETKRAIEEFERGTAPAGDGSGFRPAGASSLRQ